jgi:predicted  nucleic acid-binding Zn-ribbon protein
VPYISDFKNGGEYSYVSMRFYKAGLQTIWCTSFDALGLASATTSTTIMIEEENVDEPIPPIVVPPVVIPPVIIPPVVVPPIVEVIGETEVGGLSYWFTPYRCFDSIAPTLELKIQNNTLDTNNNRILDLEYDTSGGSQSCVDTEGDSHTLAFGTRWRAEGLVFGDLTADVDKRVYKYKKVRVTVPSGQSTEIRLAVITTLGKVMVKTLFVDSDGNVATSQTMSYGLNGIEVTDPSIVASIKSVIAELRSIKLDVDGLGALDSKKRSTRKKDDDDLRKAFDAIKKRFDKSKKTLKDIKKELKDNDNKKALEKALRDIERKINDIKKLIDRLKQKSDNSPEAIASIQSAIDEVIAMMMGETLTVAPTKTYHLDGSMIVDKNIISEIKLVVNELENSKLKADEVEVYTAKNLKQAFTEVKKSVDKAKKLLKDVTQSVSSRQDRKALNASIGNIKSKMNSINALINTYKNKSDNSAKAIGNIKSAIDTLIGMMMREERVPVIVTPITIIPPTTITPTKAEIVETLNEISVTALLGVTSIKHDESVSVEYEAVDNGMIMSVNDAIQVTLNNNGKVNIKSNTNEIQIDFAVSESYVREDGTMVTDIVLDDSKKMSIYINAKGTIRAVLKDKKKSLTLFSKHKGCKLKVNKKGLVSFKCSKVKGEGKRNLLIETDKNLGSQFYRQIVDKEGKEISRQGKYDKFTDSNDNNRLEIMEEKGKFVIKHTLKLQKNHKAK